MHVVPSFIRVIATMIAFMSAFCKLVKSVFFCTRHGLRRTQSSAVRAGHSKTDAQQDIVRSESQPGNNVDARKRPRLVRFRLIDSGQEMHMQCVTASNLHCHFLEAYLTILALPSVRIGQH